MTILFVRMKPGHRRCREFGPVLAKTVLETILQR
jgi:hypothetical protein